MSYTKLKNKTLFIPVPAYVLIPNERLEPNEERNKLLAYVPLKHFGKSYEETLGFINKEQRLSAWLIAEVKVLISTSDLQNQQFPKNVDSSVENFKVVQIQALHQNEYANYDPPGDVEKIYDKWCLVETDVNEEDDDFVKSAAQLDKNTLGIQSAVKALGASLLDSGLDNPLRQTIGKETYELSCILANSKKLPKDKLEAIQNFHQKSFDLIHPSNEKTGKVIALVCITAFVDVACIVGGFFFLAGITGVVVASIFTGPFAFLSFLSILATTHLIATLATIATGLILHSLTAAISSHLLFKPTEKDIAINTFVDDIHHKFTNNNHSISL